VETSIEPPILTVPLVGAAGINGEVRDRLEARCVGRVANDGGGLAPVVGAHLFDLVIAGVRARTAVIEVGLGKGCRRTQKKNDKTRASHRLRTK
jgi:hypothetical protein